MTNTRDTLLKEIDAFLDRYGMAAAKFGEEAVSDPAFVLRLRAGRSPRIDTVDRVRQFMRDYRPPLKRRPKAAQERAAA